MSKYNKQNQDEKSVEAAEDLLPAVEAPDEPVVVETSAPVVEITVADKLPMPTAKQDERHIASVQRPNILPRINIPPAKKGLIGKLEAELKAAESNPSLYVSLNQLLNLFGTLHTQLSEAHKNFPENNFNALKHKIFD